MNTTVIFSSTQSSAQRFRLIHRRSRPVASGITRLVITAIVAYLIAELLLEVQAPLLAPLTALLVVQVSTYQTVRHALQRVLSVGVGVVVAVVIAGSLGFAWWSLGIAIAASLILGHALKLNDHILEVPISAMLILQLGTEAAATDRVVETIIGAGVGLLAGLIASPVRVQPAEEAIRELGGSMAGLLDDMADGLRGEPDEKTVGTWLERSQRVGREIQQVESELAAAEESARLNPRTRTAGAPGPALRAALETLEHATVTTRGLARSVADRTKLHVNDRTGLGAQMWEGDVRDRLAATLRELARATRRYAEAATVETTDEALGVTGQLETALTAGRIERAELGVLLYEDPGHWPLHGELLVHLDRLLDGLSDSRGNLAARPVRHRPELPVHIGRPRRGDGPNVAARDEARMHTAGNLLL
ncbi:MAG: aromatic acid exporter family protein [Streptosporangiaceae bacterium]